MTFGSWLFINKYSSEIYCADKVPAVGSGDINACRKTDAGSENSSVEVVYMIIHY